MSNLDMGALQEEQSRLKNTGNTFLDSFVKMPEGNGIVVLRLLPPAKKGTFDREKNPFFVATRTHRINGRSYHCPKELENGRWRKGKCPVCDYYNHLWTESKTKAPDEEKRLQAEARSIKPIERYYYNCIVRKQVNPQTQEVEENVGPKIMSVGKTLHEMVIRAIVGSEALEEKSLGDVTDFTNGRDFKIIKTMRQSGSQSFPNYADSKFLDPSPLGDQDAIQNWMEGLQDLVELRKVKEYEFLHHQVRVHMGLEKEDDTQFNPDEFGKTNGNGQASEETAQAIVTQIPEASVPDTPATVVEDPALATNQQEEVVVAAGGNSESIADEDFLEELKNMG